MVAEDHGNLDDMKELLAIVESLRAARADPNGKSPVENFGFISCATAVRIKHVPFYEPCVILVLSGRKTIVDGRRPVVGEAGDVLTVPAPGSFDLRNEPDPRGKPYRALIIPFKNDVLAQLIRTHDIAQDGKRRSIQILKFNRDETLLASVKHYLSSSGDRTLMAHRLMEILLILAGTDPRLLSYSLNGASWSQRVRVVLGADVAHPWDIGELCGRLATSESSLRRHLKKENTGFRELLYELRLTMALMKLLQTAQPVYQIAYECGYQSVSRFTNNFHKRFGLPPRQLRESMTESEQKLNLSEQSLNA